MPTVGFEPTISAGERPKTYALDRAATGTGSSYLVNVTNLPMLINFTKVNVPLVILLFVLRLIWLQSLLMSEWLLL